MQTAAAKLPLEPQVWVVVPHPGEAQRRSALLSGAGVAAGADADLERVLASNPAVVLVDPGGWETRCRRILETLVEREAPPPAVLFLSSDPAVQVAAGPAFGYLSDSAPVRDLTAAIRRAARAREAILPYWPIASDRVPAAEEVRIKGLLRDFSGIDIRADRQAAFEDALRTRMVARLTARVRDYAELLQRSRGDYGELELLCQLLVIGETYFWRYAGQFRALQEVLVPALTHSDKPRERCFRVWSAGSSSGEETYSLAIACRQALPPSWRIEVHGTDIDRAALVRAERGEYGRRALRNLPPAIRRANLKERDGTYRVCDRVRAAVRFHHLNLAAPAADTWVSRHGPFHAVFCRNVLIYFSQAEVERAVDRFETALVSGGGLFLGASETLHRARPGMEVVRGSGSFFFRKADSGIVRSPQRPAPVVPAQEPDGGPAKGLYDLGLSRLDAEDFPGAGNAFRELLGLCPEDARGHTGMALLLANQGREKEAEKHLGKASRCRPDLAETHYLRGLVAERSGQDRGALEHYTASLTREPGFFMAHINRAWILERLGRRDSCRQEMRAALAILEGRPSVAPWITGGLGCEALLELVRGALEARGGEP